MSWQYAQLSGNLRYEGRLISIGYSGHGDGKNNPKLQWEPEVGPIPQGGYTILSPRDTPAHGPFVMPLVPDDSNQMFGRSGFLIHGDSIRNPGTASEGCIILSRPAREQIWNSDDHYIKVVENDSE